MPSEVERKLAAILSADVVGYARLMAEDEDATVRRLAAYRTEITNLVGEHRGRVVDFTGDNFLAEFPTATDAVEAAAEIQRVLKARNAAVPAGRAMEFRIGVHLGEVRVEGERLYGDGVNIAARLEGLAEPGGTCISDDVLHQVQRKLELDFDDLGEQAVKNIPDPVHAYMLRERAAEAPTKGTWLRLGIRPVVVGLAVIAFVALGWWGWNRPVATTGPIRSIAVLPLDNLSTDAEQQFFADGMTDAVISEFAKIGSLRVISWTSVKQYRNAQKSLPEIANELNVEGIIEGTVLRDRDRVRITLQLIDARDDHHLWARSYERDLIDVLALQSEIAGEVAREVAVTLTPAEEARLSHARPIDPEAHDAYVQGMLQTSVASRPAQLRAIEYFERAIELDPQYSQAWAALANAYVTLGWGLQAIPPAEASEKALGAAERALALDDTSAGAHAVLGQVLGIYEWQWARAGDELRRAVELAPGDPGVNQAYSQYLLATGKTDEALRSAENAIATSPHELVLRTWKAWVLIGAREYQQALDEVLEVLEIDPSYTWAIDMLPLLYGALGMEAEQFHALLDWNKTLIRREEGWLREWERAYSEAGLSGAFRFWLEAETERAKTEYVSPVLLAQLSSHLDEAELAFYWLERAYGERNPNLWLQLRVYPDFLPLRSDPRFQNLLRRIGFPES